MSLNSILEDNKNFCALKLRALNSSKQIIQWRYNEIKLCDKQDLSCYLNVLNFGLTLISMVTWLFGRQKKKFEKHLEIKMKVDQNIDVQD